MYTLEAEEGSRWKYQGVSRIVLWRGLRPGFGAPGEIYVLAPPEWRKDGKHHWTDTFPERTLLRHAHLMDADDPATLKPLPRWEQSEANQREREAVIDEAAADARAKPILTPLKRAKNKVTSLRHKIKNPQKFGGRTVWTPAELKELDGEMAAAVAEVERLKTA